MIFVDTGAWFAMAVPLDQDHIAVAQCFSQNVSRLITTDYVIDETLTLLRARGYGKRALSLGEELFNGSIAEIYYLDEDDVRSAWEIFRRYDDKAWSFTDCASKAVMERLRIAQAISLDHHFRQFGNIVVTP
jgi:predicted nucleic acid-binding protein